MTKRENKSPSRSTKRALTSSVLALVLCFVMLLGTTFAWFTDTASTKVNTIQAGTLDIVLEQKVSESGWKEIKPTDTLDFVKAAGAAEGEAVLWEPGCTYQLPTLRVRNNGNLALKYKVVFTPAVDKEGDEKLAEVLYVVENGDVTTVTLKDVFAFTPADGSDAGILNGNLKPGDTSEDYTIALHMDEDAGNAYQGMCINGVTVTVLATQDTVEYDSSTNKYDKDATFATPVADAAELETVLAQGGAVVLTEDVTLTNVEYTYETGSKTRNYNVIDKDVDIDLNGQTLTMAETSNLILQVKEATVTISNGTIVGYGNKVVHTTNGANVTLTNCTIKNTKAHGVSAEKATNETVAPTLTLNNCTIEAQEYCVVAMNGGEVVINSGTYTSKDNCVVGTNGSSSYEGNNITINGGTFNGGIQTNGYIACGIYMAHTGDVVAVNGGTFNITDGVGLFARNGAATVSDSVVWNITGDRTKQGKIGDFSSVTAGTAYAYESGTINGKTSN